MTLNNYVKLYQYLINEEELSRVEAARNIKRIMKLDAEIYAAFKQWFLGKQIPDIEINGVSYHELTEDEGMMPVRAFLMLDWIKREPAEAMRYMASGRQRMPIMNLSDSDKEKLKKAVEELRAKGVKIKNLESEHPLENASDEEIVTPIVQDNQTEESLEPQLQ